VGIFWDKNLTHQVSQIDPFFSQCNHRIHLQCAVTIFSISTKSCDRVW